MLQDIVEYDGKAYHYEEDTNITLELQYTPTTGMPAKMTPYRYQNRTLVRIWESIVDVFAKQMVMLDDNQALTYYII